MDRCPTPSTLLRSLALASVLAFAGQFAPAHADGLEVGMIRIMPQSKSRALRTELNPSPLGSALGLSSFDSPGTSFSPSDATTLVFTYVIHLGEHFVVKAEGGIPPSFRLNGSGMVTAPGPSGALFSVDLDNPDNQPLATARQWSPITLVQYRPLDPSSDWQPYFGFGVGYTFFTGVKLGSHADAELNRAFAAPLALLAGKPGDTRSSARASSSWVLAFNGGVSYELDRHWALTGSLSYGLLSSNARIDLIAADGTLLARSQTNLVLNPLIAGVLLGYRF